MPGFHLSRLDWPSGDLLDVEVVERKGLGHPDTICDAIAEEFSLELSRVYLAGFGQVLHHNLDKVLLAAGEASPRFGGGEITSPMQLFLAGRATASFEGRRIAIEDVAARAVSQWFAEHLPAVRPDRDLKLHCLVHPGSADLAELFVRQPDRGRLANDTSCGVGYAPLSRLERVVYDVEHRLGALAAARPEIGRDIKVMGVRRGEAFHLTVACALVGRFLSDIDAYARAKAMIAGAAHEAASGCGAEKVVVDVNTADDVGSGSVYLTVTGTSAEAGDDGQAGRGNRINGLITPHRTMSIESVAGKNAVTHVGKLYNITASLIAQRLVEEVDAITEARCLIVSQIGAPLDRPQTLEVAVRAPDGHSAPQEEIVRIAEDELSRIGSLARELAERRLVVGRWPLRSPARASRLDLHQ